MKLLNKILLAIEFEEHAQEILQTGVELNKVFHSQLILLHVLPERLNKEDIGNLVKKAAGDNMETLRQKLTHIGVDEVETIIEFGNAFEKTIDTAEDQEVNLILMGPGRENDRDPNHLGTTVEKVVRKSKIPVWVARNVCGPAMKNILCPVDFSEPAGRALNNAILLARQFEASLTVLSVFEPEEYYSRWIKTNLEETNKKTYQDLEKHFDTFLNNFDFTGISWEKKLVTGSVDGEILRHIKDQFTDLLIMGTTGRSALSRILMGSVTEKVLREAPCSVITTKSKNLLDFQFELKLGEVARHHQEGVKALENNDIETALTHLHLAHQADMFHVPTLIKLYEAYRADGKKLRARQFRDSAIRVLESLWDKETANGIITRFKLR